MSERPEYTTGSIDYQQRLGLHEGNTDSHGSMWRIKYNRKALVVSLLAVRATGLQVKAETPEGSHESLSANSTAQRAPLQQGRLHARNAVQPASSKGTKNEFYAACNWSCLLRKAVVSRCCCKAARHVGKKK